MKSLLVAVLVLAGVLLLVAAPGYVLLALSLGFAAWLAFTLGGRQTVSITMTGISTIPQRIGSSSVVVIGIAGVVAVLVALLAMAEGFQATLRETGSLDTAVIIRGGSRSEVNSMLPRASIMQVEQAPGVLHNANGAAIVSPEIVLVASLPKKKNGLDANIEIRGVGERVWDLHKEVRIIDGRAFTPGLRELLVGKDARGQFAGLETGSTLTLNNQVWMVVGSFDSGDAHNSEAWADANTIASVYSRGDTVTSLTVKLTSAEAFADFKSALLDNPQLKVDVKTTRAYYSDQSRGTTDIIRYLGMTVGMIMAIGAFFGALNTMYAAVSTRLREIATLRAIGFSGGLVIISVLLEAMLLALIGGVLGGLIAWAVFNGYSVSTLSSNLNQIVFAFKVSPSILWWGIRWALAIGFLGGIFPALRVARLPVTVALRQS